MRTGLLAEAADLGGDDLLSTGDVARMLGVSRQHVVDLCLAGDLPHTLVGKHRRIRRRDAEPVRTGNRRVTRDQLRSLLLAHAVAGKLVLEPETTLAVARQNLDRVKRSAPRGAARIWIEEWDKLLNGPLPELLNSLTSPSARSRELRQNSPFAGVLSDDERDKALSTSKRKVVE